MNDLQLFGNTRNAHVCIIYVNVIIVFYDYIDTLITYSLEDLRRVSN